MSTTSTIPMCIRRISDPFSRELIELWEERKLKGKIFYISEKSYILVEESERHPYVTIRGFYTIPELRGEGLGSKLLEEVIDYYNGPIVVNVSSGAEKVYENHQFKLLGKRRDFPGQVLAYRGDLDPERLEHLKSKCF